MRQKGIPPNVHAPEEGQEQCAVADRPGRKDRTGDEMSAEEARLAARAARQRERYLSDPEMRRKNSERHAKWRSEPGVREHLREYCKKYESDPEVRAKKLARNRKRRFGGRDDVQPHGHGVCDSCGRLCDGTKGPADYLVTDHDHKTLELRGRLCGPCNRGIGMLGDTVAGLRKALRYLERFEKKKAKEPRQEVLFGEVTDRDETEGESR